MTTHQYTISNGVLEEGMRHVNEPVTDALEIIVSDHRPPVDYLSTAARMAITRSCQVLLSNPMHGDRFIIHGDQMPQPKDSYDLDARVDYTVDALRALKTLSRSRSWLNHDNGGKTDPEKQRVGYQEEFHWPPQS